jgi:hypothetical protein
MLRSACDPVVDIGAEMQNALPRLCLDSELHGEERRVIDLDAAFLHRRDEIIFVLFALEHRGEELHQRRPPDGRLEIVPGAVGGDAHIEVAAERRVPQVHRRRAVPCGCAGRARDCIDALPLPFLRHSLPQSFAGRERSRERDRITLDLAGLKLGQRRRAPQGPIRGRSADESAHPDAKGRMTGLQEAASRPTKNSVFSSHESAGRNSGSARCGVWREDCCVAVRYRIAHRGGKSENA